MKGDGFLAFIERIAQRVSRIENNRIHGMVLVIFWALSTAIITVLMVAFEWLGLNPTPRPPNPPGCNTSIMLMFVGLLSIPIIGVGVIEVITGRRWNEVRGVIPFLILAIVCIHLHI
ncbi:MAG: hypothetical protein GTO18_20260 [Anaerolineales bacterium]|nr:hypothetical protein [Anaerolineales bacterium]